ncbi:hypothetical protein [Streptomyces sp. NPDC097610]|uniref:hypothetical protein n=1 Tax=Streptomyces sp. NPDC097610 TaxID=3157227 RepID=UPI0033179A07
MLFELGPLLERVTFARSPAWFGVPSASASRSAATLPAIGSRGSAIRIASGSIASTAARETVKKAPPKRATKLGA